MKKLLAFLFVLALVACSNKPKLSKSFIDNANCVIDEGSKINSMTDMGVNYVDYKNQLNEFSGCADLVLSMWPEEYNIEIKENLQGSLDGWKLAYRLWGLKIGDYDNPTEPNINDYQEYVDYAGDKLVVGTREKDYIVKDYRGKKYVDFKNINLLLGIASDYFESCRPELAKMLPEE